MNKEPHPAFPVTLPADHTGESVTYFGMTLRDYIAIEAMQANLTVIREFPDESWRMGLALDAYAMADAMMDARLK